MIPGLELRVSLDGSSPETASPVEGRRRTDPMIAQSVQLVLEYAPAPPFDAGTPDRAPADVLRRVRTLNAKATSERRTALEQAAGAYRSPKEKGNC